MTLPRFTSGNVGKLTFSHLNDAFGAIDLNATKRGSFERPRSFGSDLVLARIGIGSQGLHEWREVKFNGTEYVDVQDGRRHGPGAIDDVTGEIQDIQNPAVTIDGAVASRGSIVGLLPKVDNAGRPYYLIVVGAPPGTYPFRINEAFEAAGTGKWMYGVIEQTFTADPIGLTSGFEDKENAFLEYMWNSCEHIQDGIKGNQLLLGHGFTPPGFSDYERLPLRLDLVVMATRLANGTIVCSVPPPYEALCTE